MRRSDLVEYIYIRKLQKTEKQVQNIKLKGVNFFHYKWGKRGKMGQVN
jgi:hypothetical protein